MKKDEMEKLDKKPSKLSKSQQRKMMEKGKYNTREPATVNSKVDFQCML